MYAVHKLLAILQARQKGGNAAERKSTNISKLWCGVSGWALDGVHDAWRGCSGCLLCMRV